MLVARDESKSHKDAGFIALGVFAGIVIITTLLYFFIQKRRPNYTTTEPTRRKWLRFLTLPSKWRRQKAGHDEELSQSTASRRGTMATVMSSTSNVNRNTSIRSVLTLPAYNPSPRPDEQLIAREGERDGLDTVIDFPETAHEEETRRQEEMESLYRIRQARRQEIDERNDRRRQRREATERGDWHRLEELRREDVERRAAVRTRTESSTSLGGSVLGASNTSLPLVTPITSRELMVEHQAQAAQRERRVSSVSYADLGLARHDGSRLRADSVESDHRPLLESAAGIHGHSGSNSESRNGSSLNLATSITGPAASTPSLIMHSRRQSRFHLPRGVFSRQHNRMISAESTVEEHQVTEPPRSVPYPSLTAHEGVSSVSVASSHSRTRSLTPDGRSDSIDANSSMTTIAPSNEPPQYDDPSTSPSPSPAAVDPPPEYSTQSAEGVPSLPRIDTSSSGSIAPPGLHREGTDDSVPSIEVTSSTPVVTTPS